MTARNIVVVVSDQQRADLCARGGFPLDTTPNTDRLAGEGVWFDRAYTTSPLCCPARTSLLTGRYPGAHGVRENPAMDLARFEQDLPGLLRSAGYSTALVGKNHTYLTADDVDYYEPYLHGGALGPVSEDEARFDRWLTELRHRTHPEPTPFPVELQCPHRIVTSAQRWVDSVGDQPFFLLLSFPEPHNPYQVPEPYFSLFPPESLPPVATGPQDTAGRSFPWQYLRRLEEAANPSLAESIPRARANYLGMLRLIDDQIQRFTGFLGERGLLEDTLLVTTADHGDFVGEYGLLRKGPEVPEVLCRVPLTIRGPGVVPRPEPSSAHVSLADLLPTLADAVGLAVPDGVQGRSFWPLLTGAVADPGEFTSAYVEQGIGGRTYTAADVPDPMPGLGGPADLFDFDELNAVTQGGHRRMIRRGDWKLVVDESGAGQLYHLAEDPFETENLWSAPEHSSTRDSLLVELVQWLLRTQDPLPVPERGYARKH
ncbi:sulfatase family protein [Amycolatopsis jiangsuensis]|uniref:Arylsulfatase A-like enzyme n=1 Tax=Amycolatopsis jiangsuensis TaxID=1181879 RepID=A0A840J7S6_9PSEU|nr:sulfatase-like hydrolase/transferase [Amycolatopsis jiangsuensis]MBB4689504.1 arylsulfatase A-like enzyme [Amycolatopsis jiangsuensis]